MAEGVNRRRRLMVAVGIAVTIVLGAFVVVPLAAASAAPATQQVGLFERWLSFWTGESTSPVRNSGGAPTAPTSDPATATPTPSDPATAIPTPSATGADTATPATVPAPGRPAAPPQPGDCADVELVFARGTGDNFGQANLGILGTPLASKLTASLPGRTVRVYGVNYAAASDQSSAGPGATDMTRHIAAVAAHCPATWFVVGGYSQGASVTDIALAIPGSTFLGSGETVPSDLAPRVAAVVVFGNPLSNFAGSIETASPVYGARTKSFCGRSDNVCGGSRNGNIDGGHLDYRTNGAVDQAASFAAGRVNAL